MAKTVAPKIGRRFKSARPARARDAPPTASIHRIAKSAGIFRIGAGIAESSRTFLRNVMDVLVQHLMSIHDVDGKKTITEDDLVAVLAGLGINVAAALKKRRAAPAPKKAAGAAAAAETVESE